MSDKNKIKLNAFSCEDLTILSQDEFFYNKDQELFIATFSRYCWEKEDKTNTTSKINYRVISGLQIKHVKKIFYSEINSNVPFLN